MDYGDALTSRAKGERWVVFLYIILTSLTLVYFTYIAYGVYFTKLNSLAPGQTIEDLYRDHNTIALSADHPFFCGKDHAPDQYRVGVLFPVKFVADKLGVRKYYQVIVIIDFISCILICAGLYLLLISSAFFDYLSPSSKRLGVALLLAAFAFPLAWVVPWVRPETLPTSLYLVFSLLILRTIRSDAVYLREAVLLALVTVWQGFIRADVPVFFGLGIIVFSITQARRAHIGLRRVGISLGLMIIVIAGGVQLYLKLVLFPLAIYPSDTAVVQIANNLHSRVLITFIIAMLPYALVFALAQKTQVWRQLDSCDLLAFISACLYLPLWLTVGVAAEIRVFVPYMLLLTPTIAKLLLVFSKNETTEDHTLQSSHTASMKASSCETPGLLGNFIIDSDSCE